MMLPSYRLKSIFIFTLFFFAVFHCLSQLSMPSGVTASDGSFNNRVSVVWREVINENHYEIWRSADIEENLGTQIDTSISTSYDDFNIDTGRLYWYRIKAVSSTGETSNFSNANSGWRDGLTTTPFKCDSYPM